MKAAETGPTPNVSGSDAMERMKALTKRILKVKKTKKAKKRRPHD